MIVITYDTTYDALTMPDALLRIVHKQNIFGMFGEPRDRLFKWDSCP